ncbi:MAG: type pilus biosis protein [Chthoniobacteraceae bacterium]|nr:type pilus biosis protein [Chthoniobacteraceae bacterium]
MLQKLNKKRAGFTLVEIMIVVAIIALLAAIAVPNFLRSRKRSQATRILEDLRMIDAAVDQYAIEANLAATNVINFSKVKLYLKTGTPLYTTGNSVLGATYGDAFTVDGVISTPIGTKAALSDVAPDEFWSPYLLK